MQWSLPLVLLWPRKTELPASARIAAKIMAKTVVKSKMVRSQMAKMEVSARTARDKETKMEVSANLARDKVGRRMDKGPAVKKLEASHR